MKEGRKEGVISSYKTEFFEPHWGAINFRSIKVADHFYTNTTTLLDGPTV